MKYYIVTIILVWMLTAGMRRVPYCAEDATLVGVGQFNNGRWAEYACGPALDD